MTDWWLGLGRCWLSPGDGLIASSKYSLCKSLLKPYQSWEKVQYSMMQDHTAVCLSKNIISWILSENILQGPSKRASVCGTMTTRIL